MFHLRSKSKQLCTEVAAGFYSAHTRQGSHFQEVIHRVDVILVIRDISKEGGQDIVVESPEDFRLTKRTENLVVIKFRIFDAKNGACGIPDANIALLPNGFPDARTRGGNQQTGIRLCVVVRRGKVCHSLCRNQVTEAENGLQGNIGRIDRRLTLLGRLKEVVRGHDATGILVQACTQ